ncbi:MAG: radical SAM protein [Elusimicrobiota bacterium]
MICKDELWRRVKLLPSTLDIMVTSRCNLACAYCSSRGLAGQDKTLALETVLRAVDWYTSCTNPEVYKACGQKMTAVYSINFAGGEPLLEYELVCAVADHLRERHPWLMVTLATNGTLLDPARAETLIDKGVRIAVSLDGPREVNDRHRRFRGRVGASVFDAVVGHLSKLSAERLIKMEVGATVSGRTLPALPESVAYLKSLGFEMVSVNFDMFESWTEERLRSLKGALASLKKRYLSSTLSFPRTSAMRTANVFFESLTRLLHQFDLTWELVFGPDGRFYPFPAACTLGLEEFSLGDSHSGVDFDKLERIFADARLRVPKEDGFNLYAFLDRYHYSRAMGLDPDAMVQDGYKAMRILDAEFSGLAYADRVLERLEMDKGYGDFEHEPRYRGEDEVPVVSVRFGADPSDEPARARQAVDYCLYSPGSGKTVVLMAQHLARVFDAVEGIGLYSVLKARHLGKRILVLVEGDPSGLSPKQFRFMREHGMLLGGAGGSYAVVPFGRRDAAAIGRMAAGSERVRLELRGAEGLWSDAELDALARGLEDLERVVAKGVLQGGGPVLLNLAWGKDVGLGEGEPDPRAEQEFSEGLARLERRLAALARRRSAFASYLRRTAEMGRARSEFLAS